jgi:hypothetical protein
MLKPAMHPIFVPMNVCAKIEKRSDAPFSFTTTYEMTDEIKQWIVDHNVSLTDKSEFFFQVHINDFLFAFKDPKIAAMFKLTWAAL